MEFSCMAFVWQSNDQFLRKCELHVREPPHSFRKDSCHCKALSAISECADSVSVVICNFMLSDNGLLMVAVVLCIAVRTPRRGYVPGVAKGWDNIEAVAFTGITGEAKWGGSGQKHNRATLSSSLLERCQAASAADSLHQAPWRWSGWGSQGVWWRVMTKPQSLCLSSINSLVLQKLELILHNWSLSVLLHKSWLKCTE